MINLDKKQQEKYCNCKNSRCVKLYCDCYAAQRKCSHHCRCINCQNTPLHHPTPFMKDSKPIDKVSRDQANRNHRGCACRKSGCMKKYCECFQAGISCTDICKCVECQNNESMTNKNIIQKLRKGTSQLSHKSPQLYPLYLCQNSEQLNNIILEPNPLALKDNWLQSCAQQLYQSARNGSTTEVLDSFLEILKTLEENIAADQKKQSFAEGESLEDGEEQKNNEIQIQNISLKEEEDVPMH